MNDDVMNKKQFFHGTRANLDDQTYVLPPSLTRRSPNWGDMEPGEADQVFLSHSEGSALNWAAETPGDAPPRVYEVEPEGRIEHGGQSTVAERARIVRRTK